LTYDSSSSASNPFASAAHRLGDALLETGRISESQLEESLAKQQETGQFLGEILVELGHIEQAELTPFLVKHCKVPYVSLLDYLVDESLLEYIPKEICLKYRVLPVDKLGRNLTVAMVNPLHQDSYRVLEECCGGLRIKPILCESGHFDIVAGRILQSGGEAGGGPSVSMESLGLGRAPKAAVPAPAEPSETPAPEAEDLAESSTDDRDEAEAPIDEAAQDPEAPEPPEKPVEVLRPVGSARNALAQSLNDAMQDVMTVARSSMHDTYEMLARRIDLFRGLKVEEVAALFACGATRELEPGKTIFEKGQAGTDLYVILGGKIRILDDGKEIAILATGDMFGEMALVTGEPRSATAVTAETTSVFVLNEAVFQRLLSKQVAIRILLNMLGTMSLRLKQSNELLRSIVK
jgi:hypothetical protein